MPRILAVDDTKPLPEATAIGRTYWMGMALLTDKILGPQWDELWLDHDLYAVVPQHVAYGVDGLEVEANGSRFVEFLAAMQHYVPPIVRLITNNGAGRDYMARVLDTFMDRLPDGSGWKRRKG